MAMSTSFHDDETYVPKKSTRETYMPLQPLNLNREPSVESLGKKGAYREYFGYKPAPVNEEPDTSRQNPSLQRERGREVDHYSYRRQYYSRQPHYHYEEDRAYSGYLDDDFDGIPPPPPPAPQPHHAYHHGIPPPPPPPLAYEDRPSYAAQPMSFPTPHQYSRPHHPLPMYSPPYDSNPVDALQTQTPSTVEATRPTTPRSPGELQDLDIVCGRGAPTNYHYGNQIFKTVIEDYQTAYLCAKRSDKPHLAMKIMDIIKNSGARFVKREKTAGYFSWVEIDGKGAYEKVCQALRDGAPDVRRKAMSVSSKMKKES